MHRRPWVLGLVLLAAVIPATTGRAVEKIVFRPYAERDQVLEVTGQLLARDAGGSMLVLAEDGQMWTVRPERMLSHESDDAPLEPIDRREAAEALLRELPAGYQTHMTAHYVICHNTTEEYVEWVGGLFEQAYTGFYTFWKNKGRRLPEPEFPLTAVVFADQKSFAEYARPEIGDVVDSVIGYYNLKTNRMVTYYLRNSERRVATLVHEAVHQLAYNSGLQRRMADNPQWVSEGLAIYFETPDASARGWRNIGRVNQVNLARFHHYLRNRPPDSLMTLIRDDSRFRNPGEATSAYAEAWALNYFLLRAKQKEYLAYLETLAAGPIQMDPDPRQRVQAFQEAMGMDLEALDAQFLQYMRRHVR